MANKYEPLGQFLKDRATQLVPITFAEIEKIIGNKLPSSAYKHRPWWSNNPSNNVMTKVWIAAGYETEQVDMASKKLVFKRTFHVAPPPSAGGLADAPREFEHSKNEQPRCHPAFGALKGLLWIEPGYDIAKPALDEDWEEAFDKKWDELLK